MLEPPNMSASRGGPPSAWWLWTVRGVALTALATTMYLTFVSVTEGARPAGCGPDSACAAMLSSPWSKWLGIIPVSSLAIVVYAVVLAVTVFLGPTSSVPQRRRGWAVLTVSAVMILGAAVWFVYLQFFEINGLCPWCMGAHILGAVLSCLILLHVPFGQRCTRGDLITAPIAGLLVVIGLFGVVLLVTSQLLIKPNPTARWLIAKTEPAPPSTRPQKSPPEPEAVPATTTEHLAIETSNRRVWYFDNQFFIELPLPILGSPDAEHFILDLFDYRCTGCRLMHRHLTEVRRRLGPKVALIAFPVPLDSQCNPEVKKTQAHFEGSCKLARLALAVWSANPAAFPPMHHWLFEGENPPSPADAHAHAVALVGEELLAAALTDPWIDEQIGWHVLVHKRTYGKDNQHRNLPKLIFRTGMETGMVTGIPEEAEVLVKHLGKSFGIELLEPTVAHENDAVSPSANEALD